MKARIRAEEQQIIDAYNKGAKEGYERGIKTGSIWLLYAVCLTLADIHGFRKKGSSASSGRQIGYLRKFARIECLCKISWIRSNPNTTSKRGILIFYEPDHHPRICLLDVHEM